MKTNFSEAFLTFDPDRIKGVDTIEGMLALHESTRGFSPDESTFLIASYLIAKYPLCGTQLMHLVANHTENEILRSYANNFIEAFSAEVNRLSPGPEEPKSGVE